MSTSTLILALAVTCVAVQGCLLFTPAVNQSPRIDIVPQVGSAARGEPVKVVANASDPDGDPPRVEWSTSMGACQPLGTSQRPQTTFVSPPGTAAFTLTFKAGDQDTVCVWALAIDSQGATAVDAKTFSSVNRPPVAVIKVLAPTTKTSTDRYPLYSLFHLSATGSSDPDGDPVVGAKWELVGFPPAAVPTPKLAPCPSATPSDFVQCLDVGGFKGDYTVELTVSDRLMANSVASVTLVVDDDHPACVSAAAPAPETSPIVLDPIESKTFAVTSILDDGAPFPTPADGAHAAPTFAWKLRRNGGDWQAIVGYDHIAALTLPGSSYATGDAVDVSVTISDGVAMHLQPSCDPQCPAGCPQSAQWTVEYR